ncbi:S1 RNA-binding domain-containing protein [Methylomonas sp. LL1]|uniref:S1 RNA-binding domain-containing protein n=1 Tax=Methylomonas sp. LL1 TaxID=2785785 RepID=UPI0018C41B47|nr:S1 RNA-binding domain-containing protein [Methylomonas sp. LL1]QPK62546.1 S1 RNA-binding domain-containing protein [Methylomonas sp. LL1]
MLDLIKNKVAALFANNRSEDCYIKYISPEIGKDYSGTVLYVVDGGALVEIHNSHGYLDIKNIAWERVRNAFEYLSVGQTIQVKVLSYDEESDLFRLGMKQLIPDTWLELSKQYPVGTSVTGKIIGIKERYGCHIEIVDGYSGSLYFKDIHCDKPYEEKCDMLKYGDEVVVKINDIDFERRRVYFEMDQ